MTDEQFHNYFQRVVFINLQRRPDRLAAFQQNVLEIDWPFKKPEIFRGIDGVKVGCPQEFTHGPGAFGCRQSHSRVLEEAIMDGTQGWLLVMEDDCVFRGSFANDIRRFLELVEAHAPDAEGLMIGGQNHAVPVPLDPPASGIKKTTYTQRTHCYAVRGEYLKAFYQRIAATSQHIDHCMQDFQRHHKVYQPDRWLAGQRGGVSDILPGDRPAEWWIEPTGHEPVIILQAPREVAEALHAHHHWHLGGKRDPVSGTDQRLATGSVSTLQKFGACSVARCF